MNPSPNIKQAIKRLLRAQRIMSSLELRGIYFCTRHGYHLSGETYRARKTLAGFGFRWNPVEKCWARTDSSVYRELSPAAVGAAVLRALA